MDPTLPFILSLVTSYLTDSSTKSEVPATGEAHGLTDEDLWQRITTGSDTFVGMTFDQAVTTDPRRVDARVQQAVLLGFYAAVNVLGRVRSYGELMAHAYLVRMAHFRANGPITARELSSAMKEDWGYYSEILAVAFSMRSPQAGQLQAALAKNRPKIYRGFREATEVLERAAKAAGTEDERLAWEEMASIIRDMWSVIDTLVAGTSKEATLLDVEPFGALLEEQFGGVHGGEWEEYIVSGHRAPSHALPQFRRMGGRFYGGVR